ncbi:SDR family oxidoreductase [Danxiaibacter flavus]|uniref:SDR family oxidoreductase n=1 Tax=Danxiaibacter flavus TaxID=3049108 RepID=A0ABV3ZDZ5_9BACT|nr:SDR family oxidoreductase [Chitinophagaceae bacterium DXS]
MNKQFPDQWAIILGGSSGFGYAAIEKLAANGMNIALLYRETHAAEKQIKLQLSDIAGKNDVKVLPYNINALTEDGRTSFIKGLQNVGFPKKSVKLLLHSIARGNLKPLAAEERNPGETLSIEDLQLTTYAMSNSLLDWTRILLAEDLFSDDARVIGLTSEGAHKYWESYAAVSVAKASLESLATYMAVEFARFGLRTNIIQAGVTETPSFKKIPGSKQLAEFTSSRNPLGRITTPQDVANVIYLLCLPEALWINGALIHVDGGEHCK